MKHDHTLGSRAAAAKRWRWMAGMLAVHPDGSSHRRVDDSAPVDDGFVPDMSDPATMGCVMALTRDTLRESVDPDDWYDLEINIHHPVLGGGGCWGSVSGDHRQWSWEWCTGGGNETVSTGEEALVELFEFICSLSVPLRIYGLEELKRMEDSDE